MATRLYPCITELTAQPTVTYQTVPQLHEPIIIRLKGLQIPNGSVPNGIIKTDNGDTEKNSYPINIKSSRSNSEDSGLGGEKSDPLLDSDVQEGGGQEKQELATENNKDIIFWKKVAIIFTTLNILLLATVLVVALAMPVREAEELKDYDDYCLDCMDVYLTEDDKTDNIYGFERKGNMCCAQNQTKLIQKYVIKRYKSDQAKASAARYVPQRTAVHLLLDENDNVSKTRGLNQTLKWTVNGLNALIQGNLSLSQDGRYIEAGQAGIYFISPKVVFNDSVGDVVKDNLDPMLLQVFRRRSDTEQLLLENKHTHCANSASRCAKPSSGQGVFRLETGDRLSVRVSKPCGLVLNETMNYIDVYMI